MANNIAEIFSLQDLHVSAVVTTETTITLHAKSPRRTAECVICDTRSHRIHQYRIRTIRHGQLNDKLILVQCTVRRFRCKQCGCTFTEQLSGITQRRSTEHCIRGQLADAATMSIQNVAGRHGRAWASVAGLLDDIRYEIDWDAQGEKISLGIDEHSLRRRRDMVTTVTNLTKGRESVLTVLADDRKKTISNFLAQTPKHRVVEVCIDMRASFRAAIAAELPDANIVADPFHVVKLASEKMDEVRVVVLGNMGKQTPKVKRALRTPKEKLREEDKEKLAHLWQATKPWPNLKLAWQTKEKIRDLYRSRNRESAEKKFALILAYLEGTQSKPMKTLRNTLLEWQEEILNHFDRRTSNGFTEGCHTKIKMLKRASYGFRNRERYRTKILLGFHSVSELQNTTIN